MGVLDVLERHSNYRAYQAIGGLRQHDGQDPMHLWNKDSRASKTDDLMDMWLQIRGCHGT